jgi:hypothetical protein
LSKLLFLTCSSAPPSSRPFTGFHPAHSTCCCSSPRMQPGCWPQPLLPLMRSTCQCSHQNHSQAVPAASARCCCCWCCCESCWLATLDDHA